MMREAPKHSNTTILPYLAKGTGYEPLLWGRVHPHDVGKHSHRHYHLKCSGGTYLVDLALSHLSTIVRIVSALPLMKAGRKQLKGLGNVVCAWNM